MFMMFMVFIIMLMFVVFMFMVYMLMLVMFMVVSFMDFMLHSVSVLFQFGMCNSMRRESVWSHRAVIHSHTCVHSDHVLDRSYSLHNTICFVICFVI
mmetsp:Transcript_13745/g.23629  ORF Transcript_13745/g.23629 Transcript_13745/m.23629 type:complete len:97 (+) Transcript_13745:1581-1871(+)